MTTPAITGGVQPATTPVALDPKSWSLEQKKAFAHDFALGIGAIGPAVIPSDVDPKNWTWEQKQAVAEDFALGIGAIGPGPAAPTTLLTVARSEATTIAAPTIRCRKLQRRQDTTEDTREEVLVTAANTEQPEMRKEEMQYKALVDAMKDASWGKAFEKWRLSWLWRDASASEEKSKSRIERREEEPEHEPGELYCNC